MAIFRQSTRYASGTGSRAAIAGHPLHPLIVPLPIGGLFFTLCADIAYWSSGNPFWAEASIWLLLLTLISGLLAGVVGAIELLGLSRARNMRIGLIHAGGNLLLLVIVLINYLYRKDLPLEAVMPYGLLLSVVSIGLAGITGWLGGEMAFRHGVGVSTQVGATADRKPYAAE